LLIGVQKGRISVSLLHPNHIRQFQSKCFRIYGGDDGARTRDLCRDRAAL
jgi:hypothetical protein